MDWDAQLDYDDEIITILLFYGLAVLQSSCRCHTIPMSHINRSIFLLYKRRIVKLYAIWKCLTIFEGIINNYRAVENISMKIIDKNT